MHHHLSQERRKFSIAFKRQVVEEYLAGARNGDVIRKYEITSPHLTQWVRAYQEGKYTLDNAVAVSSTIITYYLVAGQLFKDLEKAKLKATELNNSPIDVLVKTKRLTPTVEWK